MKSGQGISRVVVLGSAGFVGSATILCLRETGAPVLGISRAEIDLLGERATTELGSILQSSDSLLIAVAQAPCRNEAMFINNIRMLDPILSTIRSIQPRHVVYVSSDAVYADSKEPITEQSHVSPGSLHGAMHFVRELMLTSAVTGQFAIVRPTLIYGKSDPHNGYGPNRFRRLAEKNEEIVLFGNGEELRDHVSILDVAKIISLVFLHQSSGVINIATGKVISFAEISQIIVKKLGSTSNTRTTERIGSMPHNGLRAFDSLETAGAFPDFTYTSIEDGV